MSLFCRTLFLYPHLTILIISDLRSHFHPPKNFPYLSLSAIFLLSSYFVAPVLLLIFHLILYIPALFLPFLSQFLFFLLIVFSPYLSYIYFPPFQFISLPLAVFPQQVQLLLAALLLAVLAIPVTTLSLCSPQSSSYPLWWISRFFVLFLFPYPIFVCFYAFLCSFLPISVFLIFSSDSSVTLFHAIFEAIFSFLPVNAWTFIIMLL